MTDAEIATILRTDVRNPFLEAVRRLRNATGCLFVEATERVKAIRDRMPAPKPEAQPEARAEESKKWRDEYDHLLCELIGLHVRGIDSVAVSDFRKAYVALLVHCDPYN